MRYLLAILVAFLVFSCESSATYSGGEEGKEERTTDSLLVYSSGDSSVVLRYSEVDGLKATLDYRFILDPVVKKQGVESMYYRDKIIYAHYMIDSIPSVKCTLTVVDSTDILCSYGINDSIWSILTGCDEVGIIQAGIRYKGQELKNTNW